MFRFFLLLPALAIAASAAPPADYSADLVMLEGGRVMQTLKLYVSGQKSRIEGMNAGPLGRIVAISRKDRGVTWTLYPDKKQYTESQVSAGGRSGAPDLASFDPRIISKSNVLGHETVLGYACTKVRVPIGNRPNGQSMNATAWVADSLGLPLRLEAMGMIQENRNLTIRPQPAGLFEIPAGYTKTGAPGRPSTAPLSSALGTARTTSAAGMLSSAASAVRAGAASVKSSTGPAWKRNTNYPGGDYRSIDMATSDPSACKAACDKDAPCKAWTLVTPTEPGGMGYCWLKDSVPEEISEDCCISGLKGAGGAAGPQLVNDGLERNINRNGEDYRDFVPNRASATVCRDACAGDSRCRAWTWVKAEFEPPTGHCWLKNPTPHPNQDECCVSGVKR